jgi:hypothetical protein
MIKIGRVSRDCSCLLLGISISALSSAGTVGAEQLPLGI